MSSIDGAVLIFGAGRTGRGFCAHMCQRAGRAFDLVDSDAGLVGALQRAGRYPVHILGSDRVADLRPRRVHHFASDSWHAALDGASLCFTAVFGANLETLGRGLGPALARRAEGKCLDVVTCENQTDAAGLLRRAALAGAGAAADYVGAEVAFVEGMVLKTCLGAAPGQEPLAVRAQDYSRLPCDGDALRGEPLADMQPLPAFGDQLRRKIYTYNCINAVITYLGAARGHRMLHEAAADPAVAADARRAADECSRALVAEFGFDEREQGQWAAAALSKFGDAAIPDSLARNGADPRRKLGPEDRLVGPARLALRHGDRPEAIVRGLLAGLRFAVGGEESMWDRYEGDVRRCLEEVCGLRPEEPLFELILQMKGDEDGA